MSKSCLVCGKGAYSDYCVQHKPRKPLNHIGKRGRQNAKTTKKFRATLDGSKLHECYLQIHECCPRMLSVEQIAPEHVKPKSSSPELRDDLSNIKVSCTWCNGLKGSRSLDNLAKIYPNLKKYLT